MRISRGSERSSPCSSSVSRISRSCSSGVSPSSARMSNSASSSAMRPHSRARSGRTSREVPEATSTVSPGASGTAHALFELSSTSAMRWPALTVQSWGLNVTRTGTGSPAGIGFSVSRPVAVAEVEEAARDRHGRARRVDVEQRRHELAVVAVGGDRGVEHGRVGDPGVGRERRASGRSATGPRRRARAAAAPRCRPRGRCSAPAGRRRRRRACRRSRRGRAAAPAPRCRPAATPPRRGSRRRRRRRCGPGSSRPASPRCRCPRPEHAAEERVEHGQEGVVGRRAVAVLEHEELLERVAVERLEELDALLLLDVEVLPAVGDQGRDGEARRRPCGSRARARRRRSRATCRSPSRCARRRRRAGCGRARRRSRSGPSAACGRSRSRRRAACRSPRRSGAASCRSSGRRASRRSRTSARSRRSGRSRRARARRSERAATMFAVVPS